jgi:hypothetical protein
VARPPRFPPLSYGGAVIPDVPADAVVLELSAFAALGAPGAETTMRPHDSLPGGTADLWSPWNAAAASLDLFGPDVAWEGRILGMWGGLYTLAATPPSAVGLWASWWIERYQLTNGGAELPIGDGAYPVLADGQSDVGAATAYNRPFVSMGAGGSALVSPIRSWPARDGLLQIDNRTLLRAKCRHDLGDAIPDLAATCRAHVRLALALYPVSPEDSP